MSDITGGCACGKVRFKITAPLMGCGVCHCLDCQKASGGGANYVAIAPRGSFEVTEGKPTIYTRKGDSGGEVGRAFCSTCGTPLFSILDPMIPVVPVRVGALDDGSAIAPTLHMFTDSAPSWHLMHEGIPRFPKAPPAGGPPS